MSTPNPGPWELHDTTSGYVIAADEYGEIATVPSFQDARLIVHRVNTYDDLLEAAKALRQNYTEVGTEWADFHFYMDELSEAIEKAEGRAS